MKQLKPRDKITQKMTRDGAVEINETQQTAERISSREADSDFSQPDTATAERVMEHLDAAHTRKASKKAVKKAQEAAVLRTSTSRLQFTDEERETPKLQPYIKKSEKAADKLIAEKTKKGYVETAEETAREMKVEAKKYTLSYDEYENNVNLLDKILKDKHLSEYKQITIGCWDYEGGDCSALLQGMIENKEKFAQIEGLFWGDIEQEEQEISWIEQADISPLLDAMPKLKDLKIKGTNNLRLGKTSRPELRSLEIISGGLPTEVVEDILGSDFPNLEKLILYVGVEDYGFEADIEIFRPLFSKERFPKLTYLGIVNSEEQDKIVEMFLESDILPQLETMDVSAGTLKDEGAQLLLDNMDKIAHLKFINMRYNYLSKEMKKQLQSLPMKIDIAETEEADEYDGELWYYPMITE